MSANLDAKKVIVEEIKEKIKSARTLTFVDYRGLTAVEDTALRAEFRKANAEYKVYKNRLLLRALEELGMTVTLWDERLTTVSAERFLIQADMSRKKRKKVIDQMAAVTILQDYLNSKA